MGQAKNRGSLQDRIDQARGRDAADVGEVVSVEDVIKRHDLPSGSVFVGYVIHFDEKQFVRTLLRTPSKSVAQTTNNSEEALMFEDYHEAVTISRELPGATGVASLFDCGNRVTTVIFSYAE